MDLWQLAEGLQMAASRGDETLVEHLLAQGKDIDAIDETYGTALQAAMSHGHQVLVRKLLEAGASVNTKGESPRSPLQIASSKGYTEIVRELLHRGADIHTDQGGSNPLKVASREGYEAIVQLLLRSGAHVNDPDGDGSALQLASREGHEAVVKLLLGSGANVNQTQGNSENKDGSTTALDLAMSHGHDAVVELLVGYGAERSQGEIKSEVTEPTLEANSPHYGVQTIIASPGPSHMGISSGGQGSFIFRIDDIAPNFMAQPLQSYSNGTWRPPTWAVGLRTVETGTLYRWKLGAVSAVSQQDPAYTSISHHSKQYQQSAATVFTQTPTSQSLLAVDFDARWANIDPENRWEKLTFNHVPHPIDPRFYYSELGIRLISSQMATPTNTSWQSDLFPSQMHGEINNGVVMARYNSGLTGQLPFILAAIAFSGPRQKLAHILHTCLRPSPHPSSSLGRWNHTQGLVHGRTQYRGVVVTVFKDPTAPQNGQWFANLERGAFGAFIA